MIALRRLVLTIGTFDRFHLGHLRLLERSAEFGELHVGVNGDDFVERYKGCRPEVAEDERRRIVASLECVEAAYINYARENTSVTLPRGVRHPPQGVVTDKPDGGRSLIWHVLPHVLTVGSDWHDNGYLDQLGMTQEELDAFEITVAYLPRTPGVSSSGLRR